MESIRRAVRNAVLASIKTTNENRVWKYVNIKVKDKSKDENIDFYGYIGT